MDNSIFDKYLERINSKEKPPHIVITGLFCELFNLAPNKRLFSSFGRLIKLYGYQPVFIAVCDVAGYSVEEDGGNLLPLINSIAKKRFTELNNKPKLNYFNSEDRKKFLEELLIE